jgi:hypothetical protein
VWDVHEAHFVLDLEDFGNFSEFVGDPLHFPLS